MMVWHRVLATLRRVQFIVCVTTRSMVSQLLAKVMTRCDIATTERVVTHGMDWTRMRERGTHSLSQLLAKAPSHTSSRADARVGITQ